jgi:hypothetical protein
VRVTSLSNDRPVPGKSEADELEANELDAACALIARRPS